MTGGMLITVLGLGFVLGLRHALDPDHLVAVSTIVGEHRSLKKSSLVGTFWGLGHTASLLLAGVAIIVLKLRVSEASALWMEFAVAVMLVVLATIPSAIAALIYVGVFGLGSVGGMLVMSGLMSLPFILTGKKFGAVNEGLQFATGLSSFAFGLFLVWQYGFRGHLIY